VDVGANIGWFTLHAANIIQDAGTVFAFEPEPTNFSLLSKSVEQNDFHNVHLFQKCVSDTIGTQELYLSPSKNSGLHTIMKDLGGSKIVVPTIKLDSLLSFPRFDRIHLLKIDVEGAEAKVLAGAQKLLAQSKINHIIMEWNPEVWSDHVELFKTLFDVFDVYAVVCDLPFFCLMKLSGDTFPKSQLNLYLCSKKHNLLKLG
jgi:FkbM family methyltransferase